MTLAWWASSSVFEGRQELAVVAVDFRRESAQNEVVFGVSTAFYYKLVVDELQEDLLEFVDFKVRHVPHHLWEVDVFKRVVIPDLARQTQANQCNSAPVPFVEQDACRQKELFNVYKANDRDFSLHLAADSDVLAVVRNLRLSWLRDEVFLVKVHVFEVRAAVEVPKLAHHKVAHLFLRDVDQRILALV